jgi:hypothetical protein
MSASVTIMYATLGPRLRGGGGVLEPSYNSRTTLNPTISFDSTAENPLRSAERR